MKTVGIVAEYNPFHRGHEYQIQYARKVLGADRVVIAMSGPFTQRGTPAVIDVRTRAHMALAGGADLILQLPAVSSTASAMDYAAGSINLLAATGIVDTVLFGAECEDRMLMETIADIRNEIDDEDADPMLRYLLKRQVASGVGFARSRAEVMSEAVSLRVPSYSKDAIREIIAQPNNILAIEYIAAIRREGLPFAYEIIQRRGSYHDSEIHNADSTDFTSASAIRHALYRAICMRNISDATQEFREKLVAAMPEEPCSLLMDAFTRDRIVRFDDLSQAYHFALLAAGSTLDQYLDCSSDLRDKISNALPAFVTVKAFAKSLKSKDLALTRIDRVLSHILLGITDDVMSQMRQCCMVPYLHVAGVRHGSETILSDLSSHASAPLIIRGADQSALNGSVKDLWQVELRADAVYNLALAKTTGKPQPAPFTQKFLIV